MNCNNHKPIHEDGENYCQHCGEVLDVDMVGVIDRSSNNQNKYLNSWG